MRPVTIWIILLSVSLAALGQTNAPTKLRELSLQDCIQMALKNNLDLQVDRFDATIPLYTLRAAYGDYDPALSLSGTHQHSESGSKIVSGGVFVAGTTTDADDFTGGLVGL